MVARLANVLQPFWHLPGRGKVDKLESGVPF